MKRFSVLAVIAGCLALFRVNVLPLMAQSQQAMQKIEHLVKELKLTPKQKAQLLPIIEADEPKLQAIKNNPSLTGPQKMEQLKAVHAQSDPQVKSILSPQQYEKLQQIREKEIQEAIKKKMGG